MPASPTRQSRNSEHEMDSLRRSPTTRTTTTTQELTLKPMKASWTSRWVPLIILSVLCIGILAALIGVSVLLTRRTDELAACRRLSTTTFTPQSQTSVTSSGNTPIPTTPQIEPTTPSKTPSVTTIPPAISSASLSTTIELQTTTATPGLPITEATSTLESNTTVATVETSTTTLVPIILPVGELRLRSSIQPRHYDLFLQIHVPYDDTELTPDSWTTQGSVAITVTAREPGVTSILLHVRHEVAPGSKSGHLRRFAKEKVTVTKVGGGGIAVESVEYRQEDNVIINLAEALEESPPGSDLEVEYVLRIEFEGYVGDDNEGLYRSQYLKTGVVR